MELWTARFSRSESVCRNLHRTWFGRPDSHVGRQRRKQGADSNYEKTLELSKADISGSCGGLGTLSVEKMRDAANTRRIKRTAAASAVRRENAPPQILRVEGKWDHSGPN